MHPLQKYSNIRLVEMTKSLVNEERSLAAQVIQHLEEISHRRLFQLHAIQTYGPAKMDRFAS